ncbi:MAG: hypothetical protein JXA11_15185 [Phycisphaerae bacterium]|nr:hypothetical protein [Phycisphaerae bacterium]
MIALTTWEYRLLLIAAFVAALIISAFRMARIAGRIGRSRWVWFFISLFFTAIPATVVFWHDRMKSISAGYSQNDDDTKSPGKKKSPAVAGRCPHCGAILTVADRAAGKCPRCKMILEEGHYA